MDFRSFKKVTKAIKTKAFSRGNHERISSRPHPSTHGGSFKRIMVFGDSNAFRPDGNSTSWPALLENKDPHHLNVFNESCDGRTTRRDIEEYNGLKIIGKKLKDHLPLDYLIIMLGTNDLKSKYGPPSPSDIADGMRQILDFIDLQGGGAKPILLTPPPMGNINSGELVSAQSRVPLVASEYRLLAMNLHIELIDLCVILDTTKDLESDMIHLSAIGRQNVVNAVWATLNDMTPPHQVRRFSGMYSGPNFIINWGADASDVFYYRIRENGNVIGRTMNKAFEVTMPTIGDSFAIEAVDLSQNISLASITVTYNKICDFTANRHLTI